mmetsp:Transcript_29974/g.49134  ORF Transcript_29974/g.49134 Transcript_29974/m.49134 type:complete len:150 (+) Transcript_29974:243-692(+)
MSSATHRFNLATSIPNTNINFSLAQLGECNMLRDSKSKSIAYIGRTAMESIRGVNVEGDGTGTDTITPILFPHIVVTGLLALVAALPTRRSLVRFVHTLINLKSTSYLVRKPRRPHPAHGLVMTSPRLSLEPTMTRSKLPQWKDLPLEQ